MQGMERELQNKLMDMGIFGVKGKVMKRGERQLEKQTEKIVECIDAVHNTTT